MSRFISLLLALLFAFQATYVAAGDRCESPVESASMEPSHEAHFGHHEHQHEHDAPEHPGQPHPDCSFCVSAGSPAMGGAAVRACELARGPAPREAAPAFVSFVSLVPDRPPLALPV